MQAGVPIGQAARASGVKVPTVRYYEQIGLLPTPDRSEGNRRLYDRTDVDRLTFIRHARELGFDVDAIRRLLALQDHPKQSCAEADALAREHLVEVDRRIRSLMALKSELERMVEGCVHGKVEDCRVIEILADHGECKYHDHDKPLSTFA
ncbi:helix-turn-helix domain-containing protein [Pelagibacterium sp. 26DY04]|uniref:MerR family transcriptional regulator n=1 Tax=Pelagibacterium sp. 26DY04 TaxID=2967130 RepID=UPI0028159A66|nr:helix-turn-helix domain-containing protein [Pelagibacterium sp. 26DY04]WMT85443.1 helix-turn-helix domain-containing protein [Pelagibacterium sp. 26DY04]